jgi:hypothetical protein
VRQRWSTFLIPCLQNSYSRSAAPPRRAWWVGRRTGDSAHPGPGGSAKIERGYHWIASHLMRASSGAECVQMPGQGRQQPSFCFHAWLGGRQRAKRKTGRKSILGFACSSTFLGSGLARDPGTLHPSRTRGLGSPRTFDQKHHLTTSPIGTYCPHHTQGILLVLASEISTTARSRRFLATLVLDTQLSLLARSATTPAHPCRSRTPSTCRFEANTTICSLGVDPLPYIEYVTLFELHVDACIHTIAIQKPPSPFVLKEEESRSKTVAAA